MEDTLQKAQQRPYEQRLEIADKLKERCKNANIDIDLAKNEIMMMTTG